MVVFSARRAIPTQRALPTPDDRPAAVAIPDLRRANPMEWARRLRAERAARRIEAAGVRALKGLDHLGSTWHVVDWPRTDQPDAAELGGRTSRYERAGFLAIGPGGVFGVTVVKHGRSRVLLAGDVVQINGRRPRYVAQARRDARLAATALSRAVGSRVPVTPVLAFVGSGLISVYGLPRGCLVTPHRELGRLLLAGGRRISAATAEKLSHIARRPGTWSDPLRRPGATNRWQENGRTATDWWATRR
jgi:hypothetical protein